MIDGILVVDKPKGPTSHDVVDFIRKKFLLKKVGHAGTLDPQATGVLIILIGRATKFSSNLSSHDKEYEACLTLGTATDSLDAEGKVVKSEKVPNITAEEISRALDKLLGKLEQIPPMFSALRHKGRKLYTLARRGIEVPRSPRQIYIYKLKLTTFKFPHIYFVVSCSKGTYIRCLCTDIAQRLGCIGYMSQLRRIRSGPFTISCAVSLDKLKHFSIQDFQQALLTAKKYVNTNCHELSRM